MNRLEKIVRMYSEVNRGINDLFKGIESYIDLTLQVLDEYEGEEKVEVAELLEEHNFTDLFRDFDFGGHLLEVYYNDRRGDERMGYLLGVERKGQLRLFCNEDWEEIDVPYYHVNGDYNKLEILEELKELL